MSDIEPIEIGTHSDGAAVKATADDQTLDRSISGSLTNIQESFSQQQVHFLSFLYVFFLQSSDIYIFKDDISLLSNKKR